LRRAAIPIRRVAATQGILDVLSESEAGGVIAHELTHVKNRDTLISTVAATIAPRSCSSCRSALRMIFGGGSGRDDNRGALSDCDARDHHPGADRRM
jgi:heat shock protein HtpX